MAYLRGTVNKSFTTPKYTTLRNEVEVLKRRVGANTARKVYFRSPKTIVGTGSAGYLRTEWSVTDLFVADSNFRNDINGDRWKNHWLKLKYSSDTAAVLQVRLIVYSPKIAGASFNPTPDIAGFNLPLDPTAFTVYYDKHINNPNAINPYHFDRWVKLNMSSLYNGSSGVLEKGDVRVMVQFQNITNLNGGQMYTQLAVTDT